MMMTTKSQWTKSESKFQDNNQHRRNLVLGSVVATIIALTPFLFNLYQSVPDTKVWNTFLFTYDSSYYESAWLFAWTLMNKLIPLLLLFIWFFTCRHWWYHALLVPIGLYVYQTNEVFNDDLQYFDNNSIIYLLPMMAIIIPSIYLVRARLFNKLNQNKSLQEFEDEFTTRPKNLLDRFKDYF